jgi:hypothetical protein
LVASLEAAGNEAVALSRSNGIDLVTGGGLAEVLPGVEAVIDVSNTPALDRDAAVEFLGRLAGNEARLATISFDRWLAEQGSARRAA